jgi:hypothetical protein
MAQTLFDAKPAERDPTQAFSAPIHGDATREIANALREVDLMNADDAAAAAEAYTPLFEAVGLNASESAAVAAIGVAVATRPPDEATTSRWVEQAKADTLRDYGDRAGSALDDARRLIAGIPELHDLLHSTGLGNHPRIVAMALAKAAELKRAGKLR